MSEFMVYRTTGDGYCLALDGTRIAGAKPDYRGNNYVTGWNTEKTYGPIEDPKLMDAVKDYIHALEECREYAYLCEYCPHKQSDPDIDPDYMLCAYDFDRLKKEAGIS